MEIWKYALTDAQRQRIDVPKFATALSVAEQFGKPVIWFQHAGHTETEPREVLMIPTGVEFSLPHHARFLGTVLLGGQGYVLHCYVIERKE